MKKTKITYLLLGAIMAGCADEVTVPEPGPAPEPTPAVKETGFAYGADVSWLTQQEKEGLKFYTPGEDSQEKELMRLLKEDCGVNSIRLRVWVNPAEGWNSVDDVVLKALRAEKLGLRTMIDFHFSDTWADPGSQAIPEAWAGLELPALCAAVDGHVREVLTALKSAGVTPEWVQIGNETTPGMMLPVGSISNPTELTSLNNAGYDAAKSVFPEVKCIVHLDSGDKDYRYDRMFDLLEANGGKYDMIGMSLYPSVSNWETTAANCIANIKRVKEKYGKPVMICEIGMPYNEPEACKGLIELMLTSPVEGIFYWEPQAPAGYNGGYNLGCFDNGAPTEALEPFKNHTK